MANKLHKNLPLKGGGYNKDYQKAHFLSTIQSLCIQRSLQRDNYSVRVGVRKNSNLGIHASNWKKQDGF